MNNHKIKIAVSSCLLGEAVRYDGTDKHIKYITEQVAAKYNLISFCPEMAVGMGVPRPPIHLVESGSTIKALGVADPSCDMTQELSEYGQHVVAKYADICGYIFKKHSPSCGTKDVKVLNKQGIYERRGVGIYAAKIIQSLPMLPVIDEEDFLDEKLRDEFLNKVKKYCKEY